MVGASFRFGGYRSSAQYFSRARKEHIRVTGMPAPAAVELAIRDAIRSIERGMGANAAKDAFRLDALDFDFTSKGASFSLAHGMVVLGSWFLCREIELANLRVKHMAVDTAGKQVTLTLASSKTDTVGSLVHRKHSCYCSVVPENICPYHAALRIADECSVDPEDSDFLFSPTPGLPLSKPQTIELIHEVLHSAGGHSVQTRSPGRARCTALRGPLPSSLWRTTSLPHAHTGVDHHAPWPLGESRH